MELFVFTTNKSLINAFKAVEKSGSFSFSTGNPKNVRKILTDAEGGTLAYLDAEQLSESQIIRLLRDQTLGEETRIGIIDPTGIIDDPALLFQEGAVDYLPETVVQQSITPARLKKVISYCNFMETPRAEPVIVKQSDDWVLSGSSWTGVKSGKEYTFCLMYIEIDLIDVAKQIVCLEIEGQGNGDGWCVGATLLIAY